ncbi:RING finger protein ETP1 [Penicillium diatomitis]|uniref:RING finger protein ETP1 n=1 Tax=Penicillium diatomitis TaxID=2819901 RepID=A0A9X0BV59_9EURO|nr:RING finger protein ETP1 [Penicillium diatomitis]KAJ5485310.1 RING finger protein ETP1 [Penicillium diatomitis]
MPAYFYHIRIEVLYDSTSLALNSISEAFLPFQARDRVLVPSALHGGSKISSVNHQIPVDTSATRDLATRSTTLDRRLNFASAASDTVPATAGSSTRATQHQHHNQRRAFDSALLRGNHSVSSSRPADLDTDARTGPILVGCIDMVIPEERSGKRDARRDSATAARGRTGGEHGSSVNADNLVAAGIGTDILGGLRTRGRYIPLDREIHESVWGIVHLYRDVEETPYLAGNEDDYPTYLKGSAAVARHPGDHSDGATSSNHVAAGSSVEKGSSSAGRKLALDEDCSTLCILAVPSYLSPPDFLGFVGQGTMDDVSHFRMIRTPRANRYMVLMKFRNGKRAKEWQKEWNGKVFNSMEPETCHVVFVNSVEIQVVEPESSMSYSSAEPGAHPPPLKHTASSTAPATLSTKPLAPPTPALIELPTCPVCLERMDETTGLLTIICQHVFHCTCLQKWKGSGCPVCRYTQDDFRKGSTSAPGRTSLQNAASNLWACLICGSVGCGRYDGAHAFDHWKSTSHAFAIDLHSQRVWDYVGDAYVHRIIQSKTDGKLVELPAADHSALDPPDCGDAVPREKLENMSVEYTHLLTSQLESQRAYFEEVVERAADKASRASAAAAAAEKAASETTARLAELQAKFDTLTAESLPSMERERERLEKRAEKFEALARRMEKDWREEKTINASLMEKLDHVTSEKSGLKNQVDTLKAEILDLQEQNRDLTFFISSSQKLQGAGEDIEQGTVSVPAPPPAESAKKKRNRGKGKK